MWPRAPRVRPASRARFDVGRTPTQRHTKSQGDFSPTLEPHITRLDGLAGFAQVQMHAIELQLLDDRLRHLPIERRHDLVEQLDEMHLKIAVAQILDQFEADEAGTHDTGTLRVGHGCANEVHVGQIVQYEHVGRVGTGNRRTERRGARGEHEYVVGFAYDLAGGEVLHFQDVVVAVNSDRFVADADIEVVAAVECLGSLDEEVLPIGDDAAEEIRHAAVRKGNVGALLEHDHFGRIVKPFQTCGATHSARYSTYDQDTLSHSNYPLTAQQIPPSTDPTA